MRRLGSLAGGLFLLVCLQARGDEGLWPLEGLPVEHLVKAHNVVLSDAFVRQVRASCVRFPQGGSGAFVSADGLIVTNQHVVAGSIARLDHPEYSYLRNGFVARTRPEELACPDLYVDVLEEVRDVTDLVEEMAKVGQDTRPAKATADRNRALADIAYRAGAETRLHSKPVILFRGMRRYVYLYRRHYDVRLVMAPELDVAFFGGDAANFGFPRYCWDVCFLRVYRNGVPLACPDYFTWSDRGVSPGDLVLVAGHPGQTHRQITAHHLEVLRDVEIPLKLGVLNQREVSLLRYAAQGPVQRRHCLMDLLEVQNARKNLEHRFNALLGGDIIEARLGAEKKLREAIESRQVLRDVYRSGHREVNLALGQVQSLLTPYYLLERRTAALGRLFDLARHLVRSVAERTKDDLRRLPEYRVQNFEAIKMQLTWPGPVDARLERELIRATLMSAVRIVGGDNDLARIALDGQTPDVRADELIAGTKLHQLEVREALFAADSATLAASDDTMIRFANRLEGYSRTIRGGYERDVAGGLQSGYRLLGSVGSILQVPSPAPDGTGTLRLSFGKVSGYSQSGETIPAWTTLGDLFERSASDNDRPAERLPRRWQERSDRLKSGTPLNFVSTADITGGSSGSPAFDSAGRLVGVVFDTNIQGLTWDYRYEEELGRSICVDSRAVLEVLRKVYDADALADELLGSHN